MFRRKFILIALLFSLLFNVHADEVGSATCGKPVMVKGEISHYNNAGTYKVTNATDNSYYAEEVYGNDFTVTIQSIPKGNYKVEIYLAESFHSSQNQRLFNIYQNGLLIADKLDIYAKVGKDTEYRFTRSVQLKNQDLEIRFKSIKDMAKFNAVKVLTENDSVIACVKASELSKTMEDPGTGNPIVWKMFTADPSAHVFNGKMYVYPSHDLTNAQGFNMRDYHVFSSSDMLTWNDNGVALDVVNVPWAKEYMWAPDCAYKNGIYYFYFPAKSTKGEFKIGVATSTSPTGPFLAEPEPIKGSFSVDPAVFIDTDGKAYMYFGGAGDGGQSTPWVAKLDSTMKQFDGAPQRISGAQYWFEACWMNKIGNTYYLSYSTGSNHPDFPERSAIAYATADNPKGPFKYRGVVNGYVSGWTNHQSMVEFKGQWYFFYHNADLSGGNTVKRSICADYLHINNDGSLSQIFQTAQGVGAYNGLARIEAENYYETIGVQKKQCDEGGFSVLFHTNDTLVFNNIEFKDKVMNGIQLRVAKSAKGVVEILSGEGKKIGMVEIDNGVSGETWKTYKGNIEPISGTKNIKLVYKGVNGKQFNLNWFEFYGSSTASTGEIKKNDNGSLVHLHDQTAMVNVQSRNLTSLNGNWQVILDPTGAGDSKQVWQERNPQSKTEFVEYSFDGGPELKVPGDFNSQMCELAYFEGSVWYKKQFNYSLVGGKRLFLHFGAVNYLADVYLNGEKIGSHEGGYTPFQFEITEKVKNVDNTLIVKANNNRLGNGLPGTGFDWFNYGGITRDVDLIETDNSYINDYFIQLKKGSLDTVLGWVQLNGTKATQKIKIQIPELNLSYQTKTDGKGFAQVEFSSDFQLWSPANPKLYQVIVKSETDSVTDSIGFRSIEVLGNKVLLNKEPIFLKAVNIHEENPYKRARAFTDGDNRLLLEAAKDLGCNFVRLVHYPHNENMIKEAEKMGFLISSEIPAYQHIQFYDSLVPQKLETMLNEMVRRDRNRCGVIIWGISNETYPGTPNRNEALIELTKKCRAMDSTRLISHVINTQGYENHTVDVWDPLYQYSDIVAINEYIGWYLPWQGKPLETKWKFVCPDKPVFISEFGGEALYGNKNVPTDEAASWSEDYQEQIYKDQIEMFSTTPNLCGVCPWLLFDYRSLGRMNQLYQNGYNRKGLLSENGEKKKAWYIMNKYYKQK